MHQNPQGVHKIPTMHMYFHLEQHALLENLQNYLLYVSFLYWFTNIISSCKIKPTYFKIWIFLNQFIDALICINVLNWINCFQLIIFRFKNDIFFRPIVKILELLLGYKFLHLTMNLYFKAQFWNRWPWKSYDAELLLKCE